MVDNQTLNESNLFNETSSIISEKKERRNTKKDDSHNNNFYTYFIEAMSNDKLDTDKVKALISLEQNIQTIKEKYKYFNFIKFVF